MSNREYTRGNIPVIHSTQIWNYLKCPAMKRLSEEMQIEPNKSMVEGLIIERYVFGDKDGQLEELTRGKRGNTLIEYQRKAEKIKPYFRNGEAFKNIEYVDESFILVGEIDYDDPLSMNDLKISSSHKYWENRNSKEEFLQSIYYNFINHLNGLPTKLFKYIVFAHDTELIKTYIVTPEQIEKHYDWINGLVEIIIDDLFLTAYPDEDKCLNQTYGVCNYLDCCKEAQEYFNNLVKEVEIA
jgi:hypothetical protein